jgi:hypothetical protein
MMWRCPTRPKGEKMRLRFVTCGFAILAGTLLTNDPTVAQEEADITPRRILLHPDTVEPQNADRVYAEWRECVARYQIDDVRSRPELSYIAGRPAQ